MNVPETQLPPHFPYAAWYRQAIGGDHPWHFATSTDRGGTLRAVLPYQLKQRWGLRIITPPPLSPRLGPHLIYPAQCVTPAQRQTFQWKALTDLSHNLPDAAYLKINWPYTLTNALPWQQLGWQQTTRYSYTIDLEQPADAIWAGFKSSLRNKIRKAENQLQLTPSQDYQLVQQLTQLDFQHRGATPQLSLSFLQRLDAAAAQHNARQIWVAHDTQGRPHGAIWLLTDGQVAYNLFLGTDPTLRSSGAAPLLLWQAIRWAKQAGLPTFDFEGSHLPGVEVFFRSFGGVARPYHQFVKARRWLRPLLALR